MHGFTLQSLSAINETPDRDSGSKEAIAVGEVIYNQCGGLAEELPLFGAKQNNVLGWAGVLSSQAILVHPGISRNHEAY